FATGDLEVETTDVVYFEKSNGYLAKPAVDGQYPAIVMIHEWWGLTENIKQMAEKLASHGYVVLAVDLYEGQVGTTADEARQLRTSFEQSYWTENMNSAVSYLEEQHSPFSLGSIGWCFGGGQSLNLALNNEDMDATVIYYG
ncbi:MAG: dienelactone hydrolase family protein, partial [Nitrosopumilus sp.]